MDMQFCQSTERLYQQRQRIWMMSLAKFWSTTSLLFTRKELLAPELHASSENHSCTDKSPPLADKACHMQPLSRSRNKKADGATSEWSLLEVSLGQATCELTCPFGCHNSNRRCNHIADAAEEQCKILNCSTGPLVPFS